MMEAFRMRFLFSITVVIFLASQSDCRWWKKSGVDSKNGLVVELLQSELSGFAPSGDGSGSIPVVLWHGLGDTGANLLDMIYKVDHVFSIQIGSNDTEDLEASLRGDINLQIDAVCQAIMANPVIQEKGKVNFVGFSQGALFTRALIERCPLEDANIRVNNFISIGGPQQGVYGLPKEAVNENLRPFLKAAASVLAHMDIMQRNFIPLAYWNNPKKQAAFKKRNMFLADINNEGPIFNQHYKSRFMSLSRLVLVMFAKDTMVTPPESSHFGFYEPGPSKKVLAFDETSLYTEDRIGLRTLHESGRVEFMSLNRNHLDFSLNWLQDKIVEPFLMEK